MKNRTLILVLVILGIVAVFVLAVNQRKHKEGWLINYPFMSSNDTGLRAYECNTFGNCAGKNALLAYNARSDAFDREMDGPALPVDE